MEKVEEEIVGIITNHNYLDGPTFRGMRQSLMSTFNAIYILDLHGSIQRIEDVPEGISDQNVFDIRPGVAIALLIKNPNIAKFVKRTDLWGERFDKYRRLAQSSLGDWKWSRIKPVSPNYLFKEGSKQKVLDEGFPIDQMFHVGTTALQTSRDDFATAYSNAEILARLRELKSDKSNERFRVLLKKKKDGELPAGDSEFWNLVVARDRLKASSSVETIPLMYRPFDVRYLIYDEAAVHRMKREVSDEMRHDNLSLLIPRQLSSVHYRHVFVTKYVSEMCVVSSATKEQNRVFPLWLYKNNKSRRENISSHLRSFLDSKYNHHYVPEEILGYVYAVLHAPTYRTRYAEFLRMDFPRVPFPKVYRRLRQAFRTRLGACASAPLASPPA